MIRNEAQELVLITGMAATMGAVAWLVFGPLGLIAVLTCGLAISVLRPRVSVALLLWIYRAEPLPRWAAPQLHRMVDTLAALAGLRRPPRLFYIASPVPNAFVAGPPDQAALAVTDGLLRLLNGREVAGVLAHEISHLHHGDTSVMALADLAGRLAQWMAWVGLASSLISVPIVVTTGDLRPVLATVSLVVVPVLVTLTQLALARSREYDADVTAAALTRDPEGLAQALAVLDLSEGRIWERILVGRTRKPDPMLLQTHPSTQERVRRLLALERRQDPRPPVITHEVALPGYPPVTHGPRLRRTGVRWFAAV
jgi:heat shock protein HtpX